MKRKPSLTDRVKRIISPIIQRRLIEVNRLEDLEIDFEKFSHEEKLDILEALKETIEEEAKKQFNKVQKAKSLMKNIRHIHQK
jgi:hypothetical protein